MTRWLSSPSRRERGDGGFLLAEALVTMAIGAFLLVALVSLVQMMARADGRSAELSRQIEASSRAMDAMGRDLRPAVRARWGGAGSDFVFSGTASRVTFAMRDAAVGDLRLVTLGAEDGPTNRVLRSSAEFPPFARSASEIAGGAISEVYSGRFIVRFAYFMPVKGGAETLTDGWDLTREMPSAVRIALLDPATNALVSSVRIPLMIDAEPGCASPRRGICSYVENGQADAVDLTDLPPEAVDAGDPMGWMSYAR